MKRYFIHVVFGHSEAIAHAFNASSEEEANTIAAEYISESGIDRELEYNGYDVVDAFDYVTFGTFKQNKQYGYFKDLYAKGTFTPQKVIAAACRSADHKYILVSARHWDNLMCRQSKSFGIDDVDFPIKEQGFIDQFGNFLTREEAALIVSKNRQPLREPICGDACYSENLY